MPDDKKVILIVLDGWGHGPENASNAIFAAKTPFVDSLYKHYPNTELHTSGEDVGLPEGQMGNSEVGHLTIGAGRIVYQDLVKINRAIRDKSFFTQPVLQETFSYVKKNKKKIHFIGLVSDGGVHSHIDHLKALCDGAKDAGLKDVFIHAFTDGRDTDPKSGIKFIESLQDHLKKSVGKIASVVGRYYAMDRDKRWARVREAYDLLVHGKGTITKNALRAIQESYDAGVTDEFIKPIVICNDDDQPLACISEGDAVICFNFRTDRCREITIALTQKDFPEQEMKCMKLEYVTMSNYDDTFRNVHVIYDKENVKNTLGEVLSNAGKTQIRIAETEKYPHVTFFFSGGREENFPGETRIMIPSQKVATYDLKPEMSANEMTDAICERLKSTSEALPDFICLNFANPDMVGHTGVFSAL